MIPPWGWDLAGTDVGHCHCHCQSESYRYLNPEPTRCANMEEYEISCFILQSTSSFSVYIEKTQKVDRLKAKIKEENPVTLATVETRALELYRINAFGNNLQERRKALEDEIRRIEDIRKASSDSELDNLELLNVVFDDTPPPHKTIHILVIPSGEPIGYCAVAPR